MKNRISIKYAFFCGTACCISSILRAQQDASQMNVLFIMADDMRPELGCYGVDARHLGEGVGHVRCRRVAVHGFQLSRHRNDSSLFMVPGQWESVPVHPPD